MQMNDEIRSELIRMNKIDFLFTKMRHLKQSLKLDRLKLNGMCQNDDDIIDKCFMEIIQHLFIVEEKCDSFIGAGNE
jgi:hypothetical protein